MFYILAVSFAPSSSEHSKTHVMPNPQPPSSTVLPLEIRRPNVLELWSSSSADSEGCSTLGMDLSVYESPHGRIGTSNPLASSCDVRYSLDYAFP